MNENDVYEMKSKKPDEDKQKINIVYHRAAFYRRVMGSVIDFFIFIVLFILFFAMNRAIFQSTDSYKIKNEYIEQTRLDSKLYVRKNGKLTDIVSNYRNADIDSVARGVLLEKTIADFILYVGENFGQDKAADIQKNYDEYRLEKKNNDINCFKTDEEGKIVFNKECGLTYKEVNEKYYEPYIDNQCQGYLIQFAPNIIEFTHFFSLIYIFVILLGAFLLSGILTFLVPPLIFRRGRKTIGKLVYKVGAVDKDFLNLSLGKFFGRFSIFFLGVLLLSFVTFGIPMLISFSMMAFSKKRQSFPDYMLNIQEIDTSENKVFFSKNEALSEHLNKDNSAEDFKLIDRL